MATVAPGALLTGPVCRRWTMRLLRLQRHAAATAYQRRVRAAARSGRTRLAPNSAPYVGGKSRAKRPVTRRCSSAVFLRKGGRGGQNLSGAQACAPYRVRRCSQLRSRRA